MVSEAERRRALRREYEEHPRPAGVYRIRNTRNGKLLLGSSLNVEGALNRHRFALSHGSHRNPLLQGEWNEHGEGAFAFEILDVVRVSDDPGFDLERELALLEELWIEELWPSDDRRYNEHARIRQT